MIGDPLSQTFLVGIVLAFLLLFSARKKQSSEFFPVQTTQELKGFAILAILFGHIAYAFLQHQTFLFPLSVFAGMGVDLFLFLSGFGLALSAIRKPLTLKEFYKKRLSKIFFSLWIIFVIFLTLDFFVLERVYPLKEIILNSLGIFERADLWHNINSPLWYITLILFYYLLFPLVFREKHRLLSGFILFILTLLVLKLSLPIHPDVQDLYHRHTLLFPLGVAATAFLPYFPRLEKFKQKKLLTQIFALFALLFLVYFGIHSGVGKGILKEQVGSLLLVSLTLIIFVCKLVEFRFLTFLGRYSFEIYLLHWPLLSRYDLFFKYLPMGVATLFSLAFFLAIGIILSWILNKLPVSREK